MSPLSLDGISNETKGYAVYSGQLIKMVTDKRKNERTFVMVEYKTCLVPSLLLLCLYSYSPTGAER